MIQIIVISIMLFLNGIFAAYEMALAAVSQARLQLLASRKIKGADEALFMKERMEASLAVVQLGITLVGAIAAATGGLSAADILSPWFAEKLNLPKFLADALAVVCFIIPLSSVTIVFSELVPKMIALGNRERVCLRFSPAMRKIFILFNPVIRLFERAVKAIVAVSNKQIQHSEDDNVGMHELHAAAALARTSRLIGAHQEKIVLSAAQMSSRPVRDILLPIQDVATIPVTASLSEALIRAHLDMHTRFPVRTNEDDPQSIEGYVNFKDIIAALRLNPEDPSIKGIVRPIKTVDGEKPISQALEVMIQEKQHIVLVAGKSGRIQGIVTLEDIIEELVGEIEDEFDRMPGYIHPFAGGWIMGGGVPMATVFQTAGLSAETVPSERLSDWCARNATEELAGGSIVQADGLRVTLRKFRRHKVSEAAVSVAQQ